MVMNGTLCNEEPYGILSQGYSQEFLAYWNTEAEIGASCPMHKKFMTHIMPTRHHQPHDDMKL